MALIPGWLASLSAVSVMLLLVGRVVADSGELDAIPARERRATTVAGIALLGVFYLQWKGFVGTVAQPMALVLPALLLLLYPEIEGPTA